MGFGVSVNIETPDVSSAVDAAKDALSGAVGAAQGVVTSVTDAVTGAVDAASSAAAGAVSSLTEVAGAIADVAVSFKGATVDFALEPHLQLDANASWGDTKFEKGPVWIRIEMPSDEADTAGDILHLFSSGGSFDEQKEFRDYDESTPETVDVLFEDVPMNEDYSLEVLFANGATRTMFRNIPYGDLRKTRTRF